MAQSIGLAQFLGTNAFVRVHAVTPFETNFALGISFAIFLYMLAHARQPITNILYQRTATLFSKFSYTLYLVHLPFLTLLTGFLIRPWHPWRKDMIHVFEAAALVALAYGYSYLFYLLFERNTNRVRNSFSWNKQKHEAGASFAHSA